MQKLFNTFLTKMNMEDNDKTYQLETDLFGVVDKKEKEAGIAFNKQLKREHRKKIRNQKEKIQSQRHEEAIKMQEEPLDKENKKLNKQLIALAKTKIQSLQPNEIENSKKLGIDIQPKELVQTMTFLALSSHSCWLEKKDIHTFFDNSGNFECSTFDPFAYLYQWFTYIDHEQLGSDKFNDKTLEIFEIHNLQVEVFIKIFDAIDAAGGEFSDVNEWRYGLPIKRKKIKKILKIGQVLYPDEFKTILKACTDYLEDINGPHLSAKQVNGILYLKLMHKTNVETEISNYYSREEVIHNCFSGGLILQGLGKFSHKTPKKLLYFFDRNPSLMRAGRVTTTMRWNDPRTIDKAREDEERNTFRESNNEYEQRHNELATAWNNGLFGPYEYEVTEREVSFKWRYPQFFKPDSIADIVNDHTYIFEYILDTYEGPRYPEPPHLKYQGGKV